jgi:hypothetical protein
MAHGCPVLSTGSAYLGDRTNRLPAGRSYAVTKRHGLAMPYATASPSPVHKTHDDINVSGRKTPIR